MNPIRVVLADDHPVVRSGIRTVLDRSPDITIVGETGNGDEVLRLIAETAPDVLILDMNMPGLEGVDIARKLRAEQAQVRILVLSAYEDKQYILRVLELGAAGYLTKDEAPELVVEAVHGVARGEDGWLSRRIAVLLAHWTKEVEKDPKRLSPREIEVLNLITAGKTNHGISAEMGISEKTVEKYVESIFRKLDVSSRVSAAVRAVHDQLV